MLGRSSEEFISARIAAHGLCGSNNRVSVPFEAVATLTDGGHAQAVSGIHFRYGYDGDVYNRRPHQAALYWTSHAPPRTPCGQVTEEIAHALVEAHQRYGRLSISFMGDDLTRLILDTATDLGIDVRPITLSVEGCSHEQPEFGVAGTTVRVRRDDIARFMSDFASMTGCADPWLVLDALHGEFAEGVHIFRGLEPYFADFGLDHHLKQRVALENLALMDRECGTTIDRYLTATGRIGIPNLLRSTPRCMAAFIADVWLHRPPLQWNRPVWGFSASVYRQQRRMLDNGSNDRRLNKSLTATQQWMAEQATTIRHIQTCRSSMAAHSLMRLAEKFRLEPCR